MTTIVVLPRRTRTKRPALTGLDVLEQLRVVVRLADGHASQLERDTGIPGAQLWALHEVGRFDGLKVGDLAQRLRVHQTTVSNLLQRLETRGFVRKGRSVLDGRVVQTFITARGRKALNSAPGTARGLLPNALEAMSPAQLRKVHAGLSVLVDCMGGFDSAMAGNPLPFTE